MFISNLQPYLSFSSGMLASASFSSGSSMSLVLSWVAPAPATGSGRSSGVRSTLPALPQSSTASPKTKGSAFSLPLQSASLTLLLVS